MSGQFSWVKDGLGDGILLGSCQLRREFETKLEVALASLKLSAGKLDHIWLCAQYLAKRQGLSSPSTSSSTKEPSCNPHECICTGNLTSEAHPYESQKQIYS